MINYVSCSSGCFPSKNLSSSASVLGEEGLHSPHPGWRGSELEKRVEQVPPAPRPGGGPQRGGGGSPRDNQLFPLSRPSLGCRLPFSPPLPPA